MSISWNRCWSCAAIGLSVTVAPVHLEAQSLTEECIRVAPNQPVTAWGWGGYPEADERVIHRLLPYLNGTEMGGEAWPGPALLDSLWRADPTSLFNTLVVVLTNNVYFSPLQVTAASEAYRRLDGPVDMLIESLGRPLSDMARTAVIAALPGQLGAEQQKALFRQACLLAIGLEALTPALTNMRRIGAQSGPPPMYGRWAWDLERLRERMTGEFALDFDRIVGPVLLRAQAVPSYWPMQKER